MFKDDVKEKYSKQVYDKQLWITTDLDGEIWIMGYGKCVYAETLPIAIIIHDKILFNIQKKNKKEEKIQNGKKRKTGKEKIRNTK